METEYFVVQEKVSEGIERYAVTKTVFVVHKCIGQLSIAKIEFDTIEEAFKNVKKSEAYDYD